MSEKVYIFGDEFGTSTLNQNDVKNITHFVYAAIVVKESNLDKAREVRDNISQNFFYGKPIKSNSRVLKDETKRIEILEYLIKNLNFIIYLLVVDKEKLSKDTGGLRFKDVFYKYFRGIFVSQINNNFSEFEIFMDNLISDKYSSELKNYIKQNYQNNFFEQYHISDDKEEPLIQLADFVAGSYGRVFNASFMSNNSEDIFYTLKPVTPNIIFFPDKFDNKTFVVNPEKQIDSEVYEIVRNDAIKIYDEIADDIFKAVLDYLLWHQKVLPFKYAQTYEITNALKYNSGKELSIENLRIIVKELRFKGIIIVSSSSTSGYKLAVNKSDVHTYFTHYLNYILPMLKKIEIANGVFANKTVGDFIPLSDMEELKNLVETLSIK
ncbi:hypothetical protein GCM10011531_09080 [Aquaticitalea lipolytica]|uniref:DUF3800 domain-containing protein n=1 Tax=Aquaticitalea lipolytica TaxID=1247562 RepID=A0A8J2XF26_9FLAO|nr:DUF3800 domain-containing protein [Aquaticitalea lipolytica]GFZ81092.1 hypothetical protein GCM10011531_09080 [Aquaticitalea lipolytica]